MVKTRVLAAILLLFGAALAAFLYYSETATSGWLNRPFKLGLDLKGGSHLVYEADTATLAPADVEPAMDSLRAVIERRVNAFGVGEPVIEVEKVGVGASAKHRLIVELPGVTDLNQALAMIAKTPVLQFATVDATTLDTENIKFTPSPLTGRYLERANVQFTQASLGPSITLDFNAEGSALFAELTRNNIGLPIAILLDGEMLSAPVVREEIRDGKAEISGQFTVEEAKTLARDLNLGALPVPIKLVGSQTIGASLGADVLNKGIYAGLIGFAIIALFMIVWYRLPGLVAIVSLAIYVLLMLALFKLIPVTLTAAGIAGLILSIGIAVDANVLIFERLKEELRSDKKMHEAMTEGFARAWLAIRDSNITHVIAGIILFWFGTAFIKGFALTFVLGTVISMFTAITITRTFLLALGVKHKTPFSTFLFSSGFTK
ncbi:MAG: protein translocase subunit SecD [Candidatus Pacebacteria bacterium]|nr:protein translocase subunit SecD [Candidatus Paceibacterota bacterium]